MAHLSVRERERRGATVDGWHGPKPDDVDQIGLFRLKGVICTVLKSWGCRMSGFAVPGWKSDDRDSLRLKNRLFPIPICLLIIPCQTYIITNSECSALSIRKNVISLYLVLQEEWCLGTIISADFFSPLIPVEHLSVALESWSSTQLLISYL